MKCTTTFLGLATLLAASLRAGEPGVSAAFVRVEVVEDIGKERSWEGIGDGAVTESYRTPVFALSSVPRKYSRTGAIIDRSNPFLVRLSAPVGLEPGRYLLLLRSLNASRLTVDGRLVAEHRFLRNNADGHEAVPDLPEAAHPDLRFLPPGHAESLVPLELGGEHEVVLEAFAGGKRLRQEVGELVVALAPRGEGDRPAGPFRLLAPAGPSRELSDAGWTAHVDEERARLLALNARRRREASVEESRYWEMRHDLARRHVASLPPLEAPEVSSETPVRNDIDRYVGRRLEEAGVKPAPLLDDGSFLRRTSLDVRGVIPSPDEVRAFFEDEAPGRRSRWIGRLLDDPRWADHWVAYWQDVLAENPGILKPKLNNTGPFRWWIHESFLDHKAIDRFVTELILMEGSRYGGGAAGFAMATQNDVPMAAKAHVLGTAFLGVELKCARCHDPPYHPWEQRDLFRVAAMLGRAPLEVPETSSVPLPAKEIDNLLITVSLEPGSEIAPSWPFEDLVGGEVPEGVLRRPNDPRERLAAIITSPRNERFAKVIANRVWKRYMGWGIVEPVGDWKDAKPSNPALLEYLARELVRSGYDLRSLSRLILDSHAYQREARGVARKVPDAPERFFAGPARRRMSAEQIVDSLFAAAGKRFHSEALNLDVDGRRPVEAFINLGKPRRAWEFASLSNERDRPALAMPVAQSILDVLVTFGWRETRQDPITVREEEPTVLQPLIIANGTVGHRIATLSDDSAITRLALEARDLDELIRAVYARILTRPPAPEERDTFRELLAPGFETRLRERDAGEGGTAGYRKKRHAVSWSNHLSAEASRIKMELERSVRRGDPPTARLEPDWRERMEDMVWALVNSPEFIFVP